MTDRYDELKKLIITSLGEKQGPLIVAIDGGSCTGKTTLASMLEKDLDCNVFHIDDFHLRGEQRTAERLSLPGGNFDKERLLSEVLIPVKNGEAVTFCPWDCKSGDWSAPVCAPVKRINIIEGSYSHHPDLKGYYDITVFLTCPWERRSERLKAREGENIHTFLDKWIPMEDRYFSAFDIQSSADIVLET